MYEDTPTHDAHKCQVVNLPVVPRETAMIRPNNPELWHPAFMQKMGEAIKRAEQKQQQRHFKVGDKVRLLKSGQEAFVVGANYNFGKAGCYSLQRMDGVRTIAYPEFMQLIR